MASHFMVMTILKDGVAEGFIVRDVHPTLVGEDACFDLPIREVEMEGERNILMH